MVCGTEDYSNKQTRISHWNLEIEKIRLKRKTGKATELMQKNEKVLMKANEKYLENLTKTIDTPNKK